ncbi:alpha/beta hydrolase [Kibdelosporangium philippinense]|uniref:Alpha/beta hydrolase n=1 Tax=Kibdelosporangium philippinense TaxID=211113 RepID=A0ABS8ZSX6_9PSEU|nr:alpha/beta hydrolase [Kibdelosporangium philippinense]MCE7010805.1 alpha/beta hydrolase [Kibdelosporangium philippinense]
MTDFVLLHGSWHGAWCWERVTPGLTALGHRVVTPDLAFDDPTITFEALTAAVEKAIVAPEDTVLVAHSASGLIAPLVVQRTPVRELVLLTSLLPIIGMSSLEASRQTPGPLTTEVVTALGRQGTSEFGGIVWNPDDAYALFYQDCERSDADLAIKRLVARNAREPFIAPTPLTSYPRVPTRYIVCTEDHVVNGEVTRRIAKEDYGASIVELDASHSPFWSRPEELTGLLLG